METVAGHLYDFPKYYDLVFGSDWRAEFHFLRALFAESPFPVRSVFEPACGTGRLLFRLAKAGYDVSGLDLNPLAVAYCNDRLERHGYPRAARVGDMTAFHLPEPADAAFNLINSFRHVLSDAAAVAHLRHVGRALRPGGRYVLGLHLTPTVTPPLDEESWSARRGHLCVNTRMKSVRLDLQNRLERVEMAYEVYTPRRQWRIADAFDFRTYTAGQFRDLVERAGLFRIEAVYDFSYDLRFPIEVDESTEDAVFVLVRAAKA